MLPCILVNKDFQLHRQLDECGTPCTPPLIVVAGHYGTVGGGGWGRCVACQRSVGGTTVTTDAATAQLRRNKIERLPEELKTTCIPISTQQFSNAVTSRLVVLISNFYKLGYTLEYLNKTA